MPNAPPSQVADGVMVLAAGRGTRLRPLTDRVAKPVVPFLNRPLLDYSLDWIRRCGFRQAIVNLHHLPGTIRELYGDRAHGVRIRYAEEERLLGTAGGPRAVLDELGPTTLLVNGDVATGMAPGPLAEHHRQCGAVATLALHRGPAARRHPTVITGEGGRVRGFGEPASDVVDAGGAGPGAGARRQGACFTGLHLVERQLLEVVPEDVPCGIVDPVYRRAIEEGLPIHALPVIGSWYEIGTPGRYLEAQIDALEREAFPLALDGLRRQPWGGFIGPDAVVEEAVLESPFLVADGAWLKPGARAHRAILGSGSRVARGADLTDVVTWPQAWIGAGSRLRRVIVLDGVHVPPRTESRDSVWTADGPVPMGEGRTGSAGTTSE